MKTKNIYIRSKFTETIKQLFNENDLLTVNKVRGKIAEVMAKELNCDISEVTPPHNHTIKELLDQLVKEKKFFKQVATGPRGSNVYGVRTR